MRRALLIAGVTLLASASPAQAALTFGYGAKCGGSNYECAHVTVPLDRTGVAPGTIKLYVERSKNGEQPSASVLFAIAGGPGQGASTITDGFGSDTFKRVGDRDLIVFDQRGTGKSGALNCAALERPDDRPTDVRTGECAQELGAARAFYTTRDTVEDLDAVRTALGIDRISLLGVSYGTKVAVAYAMAYPQHVERLVLDSVVDPLADDPFVLQGLAALPRTLTEVCSGQCAGITDDLAADVAALVPRMPVSAPFVDGRGRRTTKSVDARALYGIIRASDLDPGQRGEYPAAVASAADGDPAALVRMEHRFDDLAPIEDEGPNTEAVQSLSFTLQAAALCEEAPLPWERTATPEQRDAQAQAAADAIPDSAFLPFDRAAMLVHDANNLLFQCRRWPAAAQAPALVDRGLPDVPVLILEGLEDTRTPLEAGQAVAQRFPHSQLVAVAKRGHAVLGRSRCARRALKQFFADQPVPARCDAPSPDGLLPRAPATLTGVTPLQAVRLTLDDLAREQGQRFFPPLRGGGLRGGRYVQGAKRVTAESFSYIPKVAINGRFNISLMRGAMKVTGAVRGKLKLRGGRLRGTLNGRRVSGAWGRP